MIFPYEIKITNKEETREKIRQLKASGYLLSVEQHIYYTDSLAHQIGADYVITIYEKKE